MLYTTLNKIRAADPCEDGWDDLLYHLGPDVDMDAPLPLTLGLDRGWIDYTIWALANACGDTGHRVCVQFAADCAERALPIWEAEYPDDDRPRRAIEAARAWLDNPCEEPLEAARAAAYAAAYAAARAASAAKAAAYAAAYAAERQWQVARLRQLIEEAAP